MTYDVYNYIFIGTAIASGLLLVVSVILFFVLEIPKVVGDLSGSNARKGIENIRRQNEATGDKSYQSSSVNLKRGRLTDKISSSGRIQKPTTGAFATGVGTAKIGTARTAPQSAPAPAESTVVLEQTESTMVLGDNDSTMVLSGNQTASSEMQTTLLAPAAPVAAPETTMLTGELKPQVMPVMESAVFEVEIEITYVHTNIVIPQEGL